MEDPPRHKILLAMQEWEDQVCPQLCAAGSLAAVLRSFSARPPSETSWSTQPEPPKIWPLLLLTVPEPSSSFLAGWLGADGWLLGPGCFFSASGSSWSACTGKSR